MRVRITLIATTIIFIAHSLYAEESISYKWGEVASLEPINILQKADEYIQKNIPELKGLKYKFLYINIGYDPRRKSASFNVRLVHENSFKTISNKVLNTNDNKLEEQIISLSENIRIDFDSAGLPSSHQIEESIYRGDKKKFEEEYGVF
jgi:hypothetical protein